MDGTPILIGSTMLYSKGQLPKVYQTPYGAVSIERHVDHSPLEEARRYVPSSAPRIVVTSTPLFANFVSSKDVEFGSARVQRDLRDNHRRSVSKCLIQDFADAVAAVALANVESWPDRLRRWDVPPATVSVGLDGSCTHSSCARPRFRSLAGASVTVHFSPDSMTSGIRPARLGQLDLEDPVAARPAHRVGREGGGEEHFLAILLGPGSPRWSARRRAARARDRPRRRRASRRPRARGRPPRRRPPTAQ